MNGKGSIRLGRSGLQEGICTAAAALSIGGIFSIEAKKVYEHGNSSYITLPLAALAALLLFLAVLKLMRSIGARDLFELYSKGFGKTPAALVSSVTAMLLLFQAFLPLSQFLKALHGLFFEGVSYSRLALFLMPVVLLLARFGLESVARTAKCFSLMILAILLISIAASVSEFEVYRLFPLPGDDIFGITAKTIEQVGLFLPALTALLVVSEGFNGTAAVKRIGITASLIAAAVCFAAQLSLGLVYTYRELSQQFMPLFRINHLNMFEAHLLRLDKLAHIAFLNGALISAAFYVYSASYLLIRAFGLKDIRPMLALSASVVAMLLILETNGANSGSFSAVKDTIMKTGFLIGSLPSFAACTAAVIKGKGEKQNAY